LKDKSTSKYWEEQFTNEIMGKTLGLMGESNKAKKANL